MILDSGSDVVQSMFLIRTVFSEVSIISLLFRKLLYKHIDFFTFLRREMFSASNGAKIS